MTYYQAKYFVCSSHPSGYCSIMWGRFRVTHWRGASTVTSRPARWLATSPPNKDTPQETVQERCRRYHCRQGANGAPVWGEGSADTTVRPQLHTIQHRDTTCLNRCIILRHKASHTGEPNSRRVTHYILLLAFLLTKIKASVSLVPCTYLLDFSQDHQRSNSKPTRRSHHHV